MGDYTAKLYRDYNEPTYPNYLYFRSAEKLSSFSVSSFFHKLSPHFQACITLQGCEHISTTRSYPNDQLCARGDHHLCLPGIRLETVEGFWRGLLLQYKNLDVKKGSYFSYCLAEDGGNMLYSILFDFTVGLCLDHEHCPFFLMSCFQALQAEVLLFWLLEVTHKMFASFTFLNCELCARHSAKTHFSIVAENHVM